jgi:erythronate-4-phosphate dehydrogenase
MSEVRCRDRGFWPGLTSYEEYFLKIVADCNIPFVKECFSSIGQVELYSGREFCRALVSDADVLLVRSVTKVDKDLLAGSKVKFVGTATIGVEHIDCEYLEAEEIGFVSAPGSNANSVAEYVVAALLAVGWKNKLELEGKSIGIVGVGNVGSLVETKVKGLGMEVLLNDPPLQRQTANEKYLPLEKLYGCDFITLHTPLTFEGEDKTYHLADAEFFNSLKRGAGFINTSRGGVVDTGALKKAMQEGKLGSVMLDVWENEPNIDNWLLRKVDISTPHIAGYSLDGKVGGMMMIYNAVCEYFGLPIEHSVEDFLPEPETGLIELVPGSDCEQELLHKIVQQVYVINRDDFNTREILLVPEGERGEFFDDLRKNYPVRREFQNTKVVFTKEDESLRGKLSGIGFKV